MDYLYSDSMFVPNKIVSSNFFCMWISLAYQLDEVKLDNAQNFKLTGSIRLTMLSDLFCH